MTKPIKHQPDAAQIARARQLAETPNPVLVRKTTHALTPGMRCVYRFDIEPQSWYVVQLAGVYVLMSNRPVRPNGDVNRDSVVQWFAADAMLPYEERKTVTRPSVTRPAKPVRAALMASTTPKVMSHAPIAKTVRDDIAQRLADADTLDELWDIAAGMGLPDTAGLRKRLAHLNPGLQRMNIGNRLRNLRKRTQPEAA